VGPAGVIPTYDSSGLITGEKIWVGEAKTDANGNWSADISKAGCTTVPNAQPTPLSAGTNAADAYTANVVTRTTTTVTGSVTKPQTSNVNLLGLVSLTIVPNAKAPANVVVALVAFCK
jgi:hypothetical protein